MTPKDPERPGKTQTDSRFIVGGCKFVGVVNSWILLISMIFMRQSKFTSCLSVHHLPKHKRLILSKSQMPRVEIQNIKYYKVFHKLLLASFCYFFFEYL